MDDQTSWLINHHQVGIFVHDIQGHGLRFEGLRLRRRSQLHGNLVARPKACRRFDGRCRIDGNEPGLDQLLQVAAGKLRDQLGEGTVQTLRMMPVGDSQPAQLVIWPDLLRVVIALIFRSDLEVARYNGSALFQESCN